MVAVLVWSQQVSKLKIERQKKLQIYRNRYSVGKYTHTDKVYEIYSYIVAEYTDTYTVHPGRRSAAPTAAHLSFFHIHTLLALV